MAKFHKTELDIWDGWMDDLLFYVLFNSIQYCFIIIRLPWLQIFGVTLEMGKPSFITNEYGGPGLF